jgi:phenylalanyl-tRNA synthetase beta chain
MKIPRSWLREWVDTDLDAETLGERLTTLGLEVDSVDPVAPPLVGVVVAEVRSVTPHPDADRLSVCEVSTGGDQALQIVCGAANVRAGGKFPLATTGTMLPGGMEIRETRLRGELSQGMLCSANELGIGEAADGLMALPDELETGLPVTEALGLDDQVIDIDLTPNRADCFSVLGVARDLAAGLGIDFREPRILPVLPVSEDSFPVRIDRYADCPRFVGRVIRDIDPDAETPLWMRERLRRAGLRPLHPLVDITNYILLEYGQPLHAYDLDKLSVAIEVRRAGRGERLTLLDGQSVNLEPDMLLITDRSGPIGLAGIMGGAGTAVSDTTRHVFLESAYFSPEVIAGRARRIGLHTDASMRFERGVDPEQQQRAIERATALVLEITGGCPGPAVEVGDADARPQRAPVRLRKARLARVLGVELEDQLVMNLLQHLGMQVEKLDDGWQVTPPSARFDIALEVDLIEEVARLYGYDRIDARPSLSPLKLGRLPGDRVGLTDLRRVMAARGYQEAMTYSFIDPELDTAFAGGRAGLALSNPISSNLAVMRQSLWPGLCQALHHNRNRQHQRVRLFETGVRFILQGNELNEKNVIAAVASGERYPEQWDIAAEPMDMFDISADLQALFRLGGHAEDITIHATEDPALRPGRAGEIRRGRRRIGLVGELHPRLVQQLELDDAPVMFEIDAEAAMAAQPPAFKGVSRFPSVRRDLALVVPEDLPAGELLAAVRRHAGEQLEDVVLFDVYKGSKVESGSKSVALGLILQDTSRTLTDADVDALLGDVTACLSREFNAAIRE